MASDVKYLSYFSRLRACFYGAMLSDHPDVLNHFLHNRTVINF